MRGSIWGFLKMLGVYLVGLGLFALLIPVVGGWSENFADWAPGTPFARWADWLERLLLIGYLLAVLAMGNPVSVIRSMQERG